jgi:hypothetical protein
LSKNRSILFGIVIVFLGSITIYFLYNIIVVPSKQASFTGLDKFGIKEIYPTVPGGREWFVNMDDPKTDPLFLITEDIPIKKNNLDNSWSINDSMIRMNVITPKGYKQWKNVEMTGYIKAITLYKLTTSLNKNSNDNGNNEEESGNIMDVDWHARGGEHNSKEPCKGTALNGGINIDGTVAWKKEVWHTGGYTDARGVDKVTSSITDRWIGWKIVMYNIEKNKAVKMESYIDEKNNNDWKKVDDLIDDGGWYAKSNDSVFYSAGCDKPKDYVITNAGPIATFRADNIALNFKDLSIREIQPLH